MKNHELVKEYISRNQERYRAGRKVQKKVILDEFCLTCGVSRKWAIRLMSRDLKALRKESGRKFKYDERLVPHLTVLWDSMERICPKRMKAALEHWLPFYRHPEFNLALRNQALEMSPSTIERFINRGKKSVKGLSATRKNKFFKYKIPLHVFNEEVVNAGHVAADTVAHCGDSLSGVFANTLTITDRLTAWTANRAMINKNALQMEKAMRNIERDAPFRFLSLQSDCGTEFLNYRFFRALHKRPIPVKMTRGRPYHKNDNAHVEQKNFTHVREVFGYERIEDPRLVNLMNEIYSQYWNPLHNFFLPSMKLKEKERIGGKVKKKYSTPKTPYERLMQAPNYTEAQRVDLRKKYESLNPFELKAGLEKKLELFFSLLRNGEKEQKVA